MKYSFKKNGSKTALAPRNRPDFTEYDAGLNTATVFFFEKSAEFCNTGSP